MTMIDSEPEIDLAKLAAVSAPALVLQRDRDEVTLEHEAAVAAALGDGKLAGASGHARPAGRTARSRQPAARLVPSAEHVAPLTEDFPATMPPVTSTEAFPRLS
jgi:hypothetical protein